MSRDADFEISLLIGADQYWKVVQDEIIRGNGPTAVKSKIGYLLSGPMLEEQMDSTSSSVMLNILTTHHQEESTIEKFWKLESIGIESDGKNESSEDSDYLQNYQKNSIMFEDGHYTAKLPWKPEHPELASNFEIGKARTLNTIMRLSNDLRLLEKYGEIIQDQEKRGFIEKVKDTNIGTSHYIPHHAVKKDSVTTPIRIVYDCSCKKSSDHPSLNDCLQPFPPVLNDLTKILIRFRFKNYGVCTDIEKAFLHVGLNECDRDYTRFLWLSDPRNPNSTLTTYKFKCVLFGATCSPFILNATILKHLQESNLDIAEIIKRDLYLYHI